MFNSNLDPYNPLLNIVPGCIIFVKAHLLGMISVILKKKWLVHIRGKAQSPDLKSRGGVYQIPAYGEGSSSISITVRILDFLYYE